MATVATPQQVITGLQGGQEVNANPNTLQGNYWVGNDGNVYVKAAGVTGANGAPVAEVGANNAATLADLKSYGATQIANPDGTTTPATGTASAASSPTVSPDTINAIMQAIATKVADNQTDFDKAQAANAAADQGATNTYNQQSQTNTSTRAQAIQNAQVAAAQGLQGLRAVLASMGALNGTGQELAGRAVADSTNNDIGGADKTYADNKAAIQNAQDTYNNQKAQRDATLQENFKSDNATVRANEIQSLLNDAKSQGDMATYNKYFPQEVAADTQRTAVPLAQQLIPVNSATTASYAPTSSLNVTTAPSAPGIGGANAAANSAVIPVNSALYVNKTR